MLRAETIFERALVPGHGLVGIAVSDGHILAIASEIETHCSAIERVDLGGNLVVPPFVEGHIHLDKSFIGDKWRAHRPCSSGFDVRERVLFEKELLSEAAPIRERASYLVELAVSHGTLHMRSHVDVDTTVGLTNLENILSIREAYQDTLSIQIVAFPQSGILSCPGTADLLNAAISTGADLVGGLDPAGFDRDVEAHLDVVFDIADRHGVGADIHLHDPHMLGIFELERIAERTTALGMQGRVAVSHAYALGEVPLDVARRTGAILAEAGVAIMTNAPGNHPFPPVLEMQQMGVNVFAGSDNVRDAWWPYGDADMLRRAAMIGYRSGFYTDQELEIGFDLATTSAAKALGLSQYGLHTGAKADFVVLRAEHIPEAVVSVPIDRIVVRRGKIVARGGVVRESRVARHSDL